MDYRTEILARFTGQGPGEVVYLPDLTLWYSWHQSQSTLPVEWSGYTLPQIAQAMGVPIWLPIRPWQLENPGVEVLTTERSGERVVRTETAAGTLQARWNLGPDGDWWQVEYPVKTREDLAAALEVAKARSYVLDPSPLIEPRAQVGDNGIVALELPRRPLSDLLHEFLGWSEGLMLLGDVTVEEIAGILDDKLQHLVRALGQIPGEIALSPDNLDGQFISPRMFKRHLAGGYQQTARLLGEQGRRLVVHVGGPIRHLVAPLSEAGVDGIEGIAGPPQSNASLAEARELAGPNLTLWGGIAQDVLVGTYEEELFAGAVKQAVRDASGDGRVILGVADRVPVNADLERLKALPTLIEQAM
jgi:hypothetical protein